MHEKTRSSLAESEPGLDHLKEVIEHAGHLLPAQGPITVFIHHNTLHAFEDLPFNEAVKKGAQVFGCQPFLSEDRYRHELTRGRIRFDELQEVLEQDLGDAADEHGPLLRHAPRAAAGDAPVPAPRRADRKSWSGTSPRPTPCAGCARRSPPPTAPG